MTLIHYVHIPHTIRLNYETTALCLLGEKDGLEAIVADLYNFGFIITTRKSNFPKHWALFPNFKNNSPHTALQSFYWKLPWDHRHFCAAQSHPAREQQYYISNYSCMITVRDFKFQKSGHVCRAGVRGISARQKSPFLTPLPWAFQQLRSKEDDSALMKMRALSSSLRQLTGERGGRRRQCFPSTSRVKETQVRTARAARDHPEHRSSKGQLLSLGLQLKVYSEGVAAILLI